MFNYKLTDFFGRTGSKKWSKRRTMLNEKKKCKQKSWLVVHCIDNAMQQSLKTATNNDFFNTHWKVKFGSKTCTIKVCTKFAHISIDTNTITSKPHTKKRPKFPLCATSKCGKSIDINKLLKISVKTKNSQFFQKYDKILSKYFLISFFFWC